MHAPATVLASGAEPVAKQRQRTHTIYATTTGLDEAEAPVYTRCMAARAKLSRNGRSHTVRTPKNRPDEHHEVVGRREGQGIILENVDTWPDDFRRCVGAWTDDIPRPQDGRISARDPLADSW